ncbi:putative transcriptional regulator (plasmid) [Polaromonas naphthalenivorans CJ2]|uniref:Putative transcriptional regulator n=1 Tax=Polaromonas naphthalenivorans (strain CJ2) TaxID=365044 RepID=A1VX41_POLNA|nr:putative transcriptional regulator [Polaromonas naphthalenivorans CJ2]
MDEKLTPYDPAAALVNEDEIAFFIADALETGDAPYIAKARAMAARAQGMHRMAGQAGLLREHQGPTGA